jgi:hypothetical protein
VAKAPAAVTVMAAETAAVAAGAALSTVSPGVRALLLEADLLRRTEIQRAAPSGAACLFSLNGFPACCWP